MRKRILIYGIICLVLAMSGCKSEVIDQEENQVLDKEVEENVEKIPEIIKNGVEVDETGTLKYIPNEAIEQGTAQEIRLIQDKILLFYTSYDKELQQNVLFLKTLSMDSGEVLNEITIEGVGQTNVQTRQDEIGVSDASSGKVYVLSETLEMIDEYQVKTCDNMFINKALTEAYCFINDDGLHVVNLESGKEDVLLQNTHALYVSTYNESSVSMSYVDETTSFHCAAGLNLVTGQLEKLEIEEGFSAIEYSAGNWLAQINGTDGMYLFGTQQEPYKMKTSASNAMPTLLENAEHMMIMQFQSDGAQEWSIYETDGTFGSKIRVGAEFTSAGYNPIWSKNAKGYFFTLMNADYKDQLFFWDFSVGVEGETLEMVSYYQEETLGGEILSEECYDEAERLAEKFGAVIRIADQCKTDYGMQYAVQELDEAKVKKGLEVLENALSSYPENFFGQLYFGPYRGMEINLVGEIDYYEKIEGHNPCAFVSMDNNKITMVLNINTARDLLEGTFYHETSHIIDAKLAYVAKYKAGALYSEEKWASLNPENFPGYHGEYGELPEEYHDSSFGAYFLDYYSMTMPGEDRARVFEYAMMGDSFMFDKKLYAGRYAKLQYYSECIREVFDTAGWAEQTKWEEILELN